jgi:hypothetical protein
VEPIEERPQLLPTDATAQPEFVNCSTEPDAARLVWPDVVVLGSAGDALDRIHAPVRLVEVVLGLAASLPMESTY